jgi:hypothetical protein
MPVILTVERIDDPSIKHRITAVRASEDRRLMYLLCLSGTRISMRFLTLSLCGLENVAGEPFAGGGTTIEKLPVAAVDRWVYDYCVGL